MSLPLSLQLFAILGGLIEEKTGLHFNEADREMLQAKVSPRAEEAGFHSLLDYYYYLRYDPGGADELDALIEHLVVRETYLLREEDQLRTLVTRVIAPRVRAGEKLRLWSAACSTGEEPLTLAMLLAQGSLLDGVEIVASDLSRQALARAQEGRFARRSLRALSDPDAHRPWLMPGPDASVTVDRRLVERISWRRVNLVDPEAVAELGSFDIIVCRNALIYFSEETTRRVVDRLGRALRPDGVLVVSVTESLLRFGTALICDELDGVFFYRQRDSERGPDAPREAANPPRRLDRPGGLAAVALGPRDHRKVD